MSDGSTNARSRKRTRTVEDSEDTDNHRKKARIDACSTDKMSDTGEEVKSAESKQHRALRNGHRLSTPCGGVLIRRGEFGSGVRTLSKFKCKRGQSIFPGVPVKLVSDSEYNTTGSPGSRWQTYGIEWNEGLIAVPRAPNQDTLLDPVFLCNSPCRERGEKANAQYAPDYKNTRLGLKALCSIGPDEDILVSYGPEFAKLLRELRQEQEHADAAASALAAMKERELREHQCRLQPFERLCFRCLYVFHRTRFVRHRFECAAAAKGRAAAKGSDHR